MGERGREAWDDQSRICNKAGRSLPLVEIQPHEIDTDSRMPGLRNHEISLEQGVRRFSKLTTIPCGAVPVLH